VAWPGGRWRDEEMENKKKKFTATKWSIRDGYAFEDEDGKTYGSDHNGNPVETPETARSLGRVWPLTYGASSVEIDYSTA